MPDRRARDQFLGAIHQHRSLPLEVLPPMLCLQETRPAGHMTTITFIDGKQVDGEAGADREGLLGSDDDFLVFLSRASDEPSQIAQKIGRSSGR